MKLFRRFLPVKTSIQWPSDEVEAARGVRQEVADMLSWDEEDELELEEFEVDELDERTRGWNMVDSLAIISGLLDDESNTDPTAYPWDWPRFAYMKRSSLDMELILQLDQDAPLPPIFPITAEVVQMPVPLLAQRNSVNVNSVNVDADYALRIIFTQPGSFVLERHFSYLNVKERTLYFKSTEEDTLEEDKLPGEMEQMEEQLKRTKEDETHALVVAMKNEWKVWLDVLPYPPALDQFSPGYYLMTSKELNPGVVKGLDFQEVKQAREDHDYKEFDFIEEPGKVYLCLDNPLSRCQISGDQAHRL